MWFQTRTWTPVHLPISLTPGNVQAQEFSPNFNAFYVIQIEANTNRGIDFEKLDCLLGTSMKQKECSMPSVIRAHWILSSDNSIVKRGSSYEMYCCGSSYSNYTIGRQIGRFQTKKGVSYRFEITIEEDGSALAPANPTLVVEEGGDFAESGSWIEGLLLLPCGGACLVGIVLLVSSAIGQFRKKSADPNRGQPTGI